MINENTISNMKREYKQPRAKVIVCTDSLMTLSLPTSDKPADSQPAGARTRREYDYMYLDEFEEFDE